MREAAADTSQVEHRIVHRRGLVARALTEAIERDPRHGDGARGERARAHGFLARQRVEVTEPGTVENRYAVVGKGQERGERRVDGVEQALPLLTEPERAGMTVIGPRFDHLAGRNARTTTEDLVLTFDEVEAHGTRTKPSISRRAVR